MLTDALNIQFVLLCDIDWLVKPVNIFVENRERGIPPI
jgi:hypothetical protein